MADQQEPKKDYVVMLDIHFIGIHVQAINKSEANDLAITALDELHKKNEGLTGIEYGLRGTKVLEVRDEPVGPTESN